MIRGVISESSFLGLDYDERRIAVELVKRLNYKTNRNLLRRRYYDGHNALKDLGIAIPPPLKTVEVVVGWPAKAVDSMIDRTTLQGFISTSGSSTMNAFLTDVWESNRLAVEIPSAHTRMTGSSYLRAKSRSRWSCAGTAISTLTKARKMTTTTSKRATAHTAKTTPKTNKTHKKKLKNTPIYKKKTKNRILKKESKKPFSKNN